MDRLWFRVLFKPSQAVAKVTENPEAPILALLPVIAGICIAASVVVGFRSLMTLPAQFGTILLVGPPIAIVSSWWARVSLGWAGRAVKRQQDKGQLSAIIAWSWLPPALLSLISVIITRSFSWDWSLPYLFICGLLWQLSLIAVCLRDRSNLNWKRLLTLLVIATVIFIAGWAALGAGFALFEGDLFKTAGVL